MNTQRLNQSIFQWAGLGATVDNSLARRVRLMRLQKQLTRSAMAEQLGIGESDLVLLENGLMSLGEKAIDTVLLFMENEVKEETQQ